MFNLNKLFVTGVWLEYLIRCRHFSLYYRKEGYLRDTLVDLSNNLIELGIGLNIKEEIDETIIEFDTKYPINEEEDESKKSDDIKKEDRLEVSIKAKKWHYIIKEDVANINVIEMKLLSGLDVKELTKLANKEPSLFFTQEVWNKLSDIEKNDFSDAAKCLLLNTATPSVMVVLRGAEASLRLLYEEKTRLNPENKTWRQLTKELNDKSKEYSLDQRFINFLDAFGDSKRNLAQHPNKIYTIREAVAIFMQVIGLVEEIYLELE